MGDQSSVIDRPCRPDSLRLSPAFPRVVVVARQFVSRGERMRPSLDKLRCAGLIGVAAAVLALIVLERASAQQPGGAVKTSSTHALGQPDDPRHHPTAAQRGEGPRRDQLTANQRGE
jgi:hypothetical protein